MPLARLAGKLLRVEGLLSTDCCCDVDPVCVYVLYEHPAWIVADSPLPASNCGAGVIGFFGCDYIAGTQYIAKPAALAGREALVHITGGFDDSIAIDGAVIGSCRAAGEVNHTFSLSATQGGFTLGAVDSFGVCCHGRLSICFQQNNPLP